MRKIFLHLLMQLLIVCIGGQLMAQIPSGYYSPAVGKKKAELKTALHAIIKNATVLNYGSGDGKTWSGFAQTDVRPDGTVWDMYS
ncbi:MAG: nuclease, partial [Bacteroidetes bacterium]|nr:nuclease [Bacteroidota bacterium]